MIGRLLTLTIIYRGDRLRPRHSLTGPVLCASHSWASQRRPGSKCEGKNSRRGWHWVNKKYFKKTIVFFFFFVFFFRPFLSSTGARLSGAFRRVSLPVSGWFFFTDRCRRGGKVVSEEVKRGGHQRPARGINWKAAGAPRWAVGETKMAPTTDPTVYLSSSLRRVWPFK